LRAEGACEYADLSFPKIISGHIDDAIPRRSNDHKGPKVVKHPDVSYLELRCQALEKEISLSAHEATIRDLTLRKLHLEDELELLRQQWLKLERWH
jgi:hypothetical protein